MFYEKIMNVDFTIRDEKKGCVIIGGIYDKFSLEDLDVTGKNIIVRNTINEFVFQVKKIDISTSIVGKINIAFILVDSDNFCKIMTGYEVLKIRE